MHVQADADVPADVPSSQPDCFCGDAWQAMVSDLEPHASEILERFCIREIIRLVSDDLITACLSDVDVFCFCSFNICNFERDMEPGFACHWFTGVSALAWLILLCWTQLRLRHHSE